MNLILELAYTLKAFLDQGSEKRGFGFKTSSTLMGSLWVIMVQLRELKNQTQQWATQQLPFSYSLEKRSRGWGCLSLFLRRKMRSPNHGSCCVKKAVLWEDSFNTIEVLWNFPTLLGFKSHSVPVICICSMLMTLKRPSRAISRKKPLAYYFGLTVTYEAGKQHWLLIPLVSADCWSTQCTCHWLYNCCSCLSSPIQQSNALTKFCPQFYNYIHAYR